jgi:hypothetical protein
VKSFFFKGVVEYLEGLVTCIDTPRLDYLDITFFNQIDFDTPRLAQFINRTPKLWRRQALVEFDDNSARVRLPPVGGTFRIAISCSEPDWQLSSVAQVCNPSFPPLPPLSTVEDLYIDHKYSQLVWKSDPIENQLWLQLLLAFTAVKNLYLCKEFAPGIAATLQDLVGGRITEVLPSLQNIFVEGLRVESSEPLEENLGQFASARLHSGHPIAISVRDRNRPRM